MNGVGCEAKQEKIIQIADEYRILIRLSSPSDEELERIDEILELAIFDVELSNSLNQIDEALAIEISLVENNNLDISVSSDINSDEIQAQDNQNSK